VGPPNEQTTLLLAPDLPTPTRLIVERRVEVEDFAPELLRDAVAVHLDV
jgi:hypothetical protein